MRWLSLVALTGAVWTGILAGAFAKQAVAQEKIEQPRILKRKPAEGEVPQVRPVPLGVINDVEVRTIAKGGDWKQRFRMALPKFGHRNWIVIADSAYPSQSSPGIETFYTGADHVEVLKVVLEELAKTKHVRPVVHLDAELSAIPESDAPGIEVLRREMRETIGKLPTESLPHEAIISKLDEAGKQFHVLILKTKLTLPYTSVFLQLDCGYWSPEAEQRLRKALEAGK